MIISMQKSLFITRKNVSNSFLSKLNIDEGKTVRESFIDLLKCTDSDVLKAVEPIIHLYSKCFLAWLLRLLTYVISLLCLIVYECVCLFLLFICL